MSLSLHHIALPESLNFVTFHDVSCDTRSRTRRLSEVLIFILLSVCLLKMFANQIMCLANEFYADGTEGAKEKAPLTQQ